MMAQETIAAETKNEENGNIRHVPLFRKKRVIIPFLLIILAGVFAVWYWYTHLRGFVSTDDAYIDADRVSISSKILGRISRLTTDEGHVVKEGEEVVRLDDIDLQAQVEQAKASLAFAQDSLPLAKVNLDRATDDFNRAEVQFKGAIITKEQYVHARQALEAARAEYAIAVSRIGVAKAQLGLVETQLQNTVMTAPFDGVVAKRWLIEGDVVQPGQPILTIYYLEKIWVTANLEETKLGKVKLQDDVEISVDTYPGRVFSGKVVLIGGYAASQFSLIPPNNASGNFTKITQRVPLRISLEGLTPEISKNLPLRPGMSAEIKIRAR
jgi:membrane fusion protein (multidrug efflux system)